jgi:hypothetical protein
MTARIGRVVLVLFALTVGAAAGAARQATCGRIDVYVVDSAFDLSEVQGTGLASVGYCGWLGAGK